MADEMIGDRWHWVRHRWSRWDVQPMRVRSTAYGVPLEDWREGFGQQRTCTVCGKMQLRVIRVKES